MSGTGQKINASHERRDTRRGPARRRRGAAHRPSNLTHHPRIGSWFSVWDDSTDGVVCAKCQRRAQRAARLGVRM